METKYELINKTRKTTLLSSLKVADTLFSRMVGLIKTQTLEKGEGLLIKKCNSIHTFFMHFPIDVAFVDSKFQVTKILLNLRPWRISKIYFKSSHVIETRSNGFLNTIKEGDQLEVICLN